MATKERLIVKTSYMDVLERMLRKRGVKVVMSGVREMTLAEEIRNLAELGGDKKSGRAWSRSKCYRQNDTEI